MNNDDVHAIHQSRGVRIGYTKSVAAKRLSNRLGLTAGAVFFCLRHVHHHASWCGSRRARQSGRSRSARRPGHPGPARPRRRSCG
ncbi:hypothetical protein ACFFX0_24100 [Citricoccus parietis]|uniref:Uncharacterized protein n=1 Tax=Citricoccus parietis TaxID=592307 RepID=A0ABV5G597_9MICC